MLGGVNHAVLIKKALVALDHDRKINLVFKGNPGAPVGQNVGAHGAGGMHSGEGDQNLEVVRQEASLYDFGLVAVAAREQGLVVSAGNPLGSRG